MHLNVHSICTSYSTHSKNQFALPISHQFWYLMTYSNIKLSILIFRYAFKCLFNLHFFFHWLLSLYFIDCEIIYKPRFIVQQASIVDYPTQIIVDYYGRIRTYFIVTIYIRGKNMYILISLSRNYTITFIKTRYVFSTTNFNA